MPFRRLRSEVLGLRLSCLCQIVFLCEWLASGLFTAYIWCVLLVLGLRYISIPRQNFARDMVSLQGDFEPFERLILTTNPGSSMLFLGFLTAFTLRTRLAFLNKRNESIIAGMSKDEKEAINDTSSEEVWDNDPRYVFMT